MRRPVWTLLFVGMIGGAFVGACSSSGDDDDSANNTGSGGASNTGSGGSGASNTGSGGSANTGSGSGGKGSGNTSGSGGQGAAGTSTGGSGGSTQPSDLDGGVVDAGPTIHDMPFVPTGQPITADMGKWTWIDFPDTTCRDGSMGGAAVSLMPNSKKLMIYLEGGGACFDSLTCLMNPALVGGQSAEQTTGVFDRSNASNPVKDWNVVYVPYCTGDVHAGTNDNGMVDGVDGVQHFVGRLNLKAILNRVVPTFADLDQVLLTGVSAGGFGASANVEFVSWAFDGVPITMVDDSGPPMSDTYLPSCLQSQWRQTWGLDGSLLADCGDDCPNHDDYELDYSKHLSKKFPDRFGGLIDSTDDSVITLFYGYGQNNCTGSILTPVPADMYKAGLLDYREFVKANYPTFGTFYPDDTQHTWLGLDLFYTAKAGDAMLVNWFSDIVNGVQATHEGP